MITTINNTPFDDFKLKSVNQILYKNGKISSDFETENMTGLPLRKIATMPK